MEAWTRIRLLRKGEVADLEVLGTSTDGVSFRWPERFLDEPRLGEVLHLLLDTRMGPLIAPVRADVVAVESDAGGTRVVCAFRVADTQTAPAAGAVVEQDNRREMFRVMPKSGERIRVVLSSEEARLEGWLVDVSAGGLKLATHATDFADLTPRSEAQLHVTLPGFEDAVSIACRIVRVVKDVKPRTFAVEFQFPKRHDEFERRVMAYVMRRQREIIQVLRGDRG